MSAPPPARPARAGVFTVFCTGMSVYGHAHISHDAVPLPGVVIGALLVFGMAWAATARECGYRTILAWMLWGQLALHVALSATHTLFLGGGAVQSYYHHALGAAHPGHVPGMPPPSASEDSAPAMLAFHLVAAMISAWWLRRGEAAAFALVQSLGGVLVPRLLLRPRPLVGIAAPRPTRPAPIDVPPLHDTLLPRVRMLRGPPPGTHIR
jgi:hypothetical protein